jgi:hypothetical protein
LESEPLPAAHGVEKIDDARAAVFAAVSPHCMMTLIQPDWLNLHDRTVYAKLMTITDDDDRNTDHHSSSKERMPRVSWQQLSSPPSSEYRCTLVVSGHEMLSLGDGCERYDLDSGVWTPMAQPDKHLFSHAGDACVWPPGSGDVYTFGPNQGGWSSPLRYNMALDRWTRMAQLPTLAVRAERTRCVSLTDRILVLDNRHDIRTPDLHEFDPVGNKWTTLTTWRLPMMGAEFKLPRVLMLRAAFDMLFAIVHSFDNVFLFHCTLPRHVTMTSASSSATSTFVSLGDCPGWHSRKMNMGGLADLARLYALFPDSSTI